MADEAMQAPPHPKTGRPYEPGAAGQGERPRGSDDGPNEPDEDYTGWRNGQKYIFNVIHGGVHAGSASFGFADETRTSWPKIGLIPEQQVSEALRCYLRPAEFAEALDELLSSHVLILRSEGPVGKHTGALALLDACGVKKITRVSPAYSLADLRRFVAAKAEPNHGYLVQDRMPDQRAAEVAHFETAELCREFAERGSFLVITTTYSTQPHALESLTSIWSMPPVRLLLERYLRYLGGPALSEEDSRRVAERAGNCRSPGQVARFATALVGKGVDAALAALDSDHRTAVHEWFEKVPTLRDLLTVTTLAFAHGIPVRMFETALAQLEEHFAAEFAAERGDPAATAGQPMQASQPTQTGSGTGVEEPHRAGPYQQIRKRHTHLDGLVTTVSRPGRTIDGPYEKVVVFAIDGYRGLVLEELVGLYDQSFWGRVFEWLRDLVRVLDIQLRAEVARGLAELYRHSGADVENELFVPWSTNSPTQRITLVFTLWWMCQDATSSARALRLVLGWAEAGNQRRRATAALALAGELGLRYPTDARDWLWHLAVERETNNEIAVTACGDLFVNLVESRSGAGNLLNFVARQLDGFQTPGHSRLALRRACDVVLSVLSAGRVAGVTGVEPAILVCLRQNPKRCGVAGRLWAEVLISRPHRHEAIKQLAQALRNLADHGDPDGLTRSLGDAIGAWLPAEYHSELIRDLTAQDSGRRADVTNLLDILINAVRRATKQRRSLL